MFCVKCGNSLEDGQNFCNNCGNKVENNLFSNDEGLYNKEENITNSENKNIDIEETSAKIVSEVTEVVNNIVDKSKEAIEKIKLDEVKKKSNTVKIFMTLTIAIIILFTVSFALRSTPEKTIKNLAKAIENNDITKALSYTNYKTVLKNERGYTDLELYEEIRKQEENFKTSLDGREIKIDNIKEIVKGKNIAKFNLEMTIIDGSYIESAPFSVILFKDKGAWVIDVIASDESTGEDFEDFDY